MIASILPYAIQPKDCMVHVNWRLSIPCSCMMHDSPSDCSTSAVGRLLHAADLSVCLEAVAQAAVHSCPLQDTFVYTA